MALAKNLRVHESVGAWIAERNLERNMSHARTGRGFVPTMGALHEGHASLIRRSAEENPQTLVSIFVNPTQFDDPRDLEKYPRTLETDLALCAAAGATDVLLPRAEELYADQYRYRVTENDKSAQFCGAHRPGHFDGVLTVVLKLLQIAGAQRAYFGEKDFQQLELVRGMAKAFFLSTQIIGCPTVREDTGLALSSRNTRLSERDHAHAKELYAVLNQSRGLNADETAAILKTQGFDVDYVQDWTSENSPTARRLAAVRMGEVRLIDNVQL